MRLTVLEKRHAVAVLLFLAKQKEPICKKRIQEHLNADKVILARVRELEGAGLIKQFCTEKNWNNTHYVELTESGKEIAKLLKKCERTMGKTS